jgi:glycosyltransferase involved in cell wall biosynthesis
MNAGPLSFCMVTTFFPPAHFGGDATYVYRLSQALAESGHSVTVIHAPDAFHALGGREGPAPPLHENVTVVPLTEHAGRLAPLGTYLTGRPLLHARQLSRVLDRGYDVIHFHNISLAGGPGILGLGRSRVRLYTAHEHWLVCPMHVLWKNNRKPCDRPECLRCTLHFRRPPQLWRSTSLLDRQTRHVDLFLAPSRFTSDMHRRRGFPRPLEVLPYFIPESPEPSERTADRNDEPYFLVVARLERLKGVQTVIETFRAYDKASLLVVGDGTYAAELRRLAAGVHTVTFLGSVPFTELASLYRDAIAVIAPSIGYETFGMTSIEGFVHGTPAIVRDLGALPEPVRASGGGIVFRTDRELRDALDALQSDLALRDDMGRRGHEGWRARWSTEPHLERYYELIESALSAKNDARAGLR